MGIEPWRRMRPRHQTWLNESTMQRFDVAVIGAGAAGMMCAAVAGQRGRKVVLIEHAERLAEKIRISGGGRCNFTNLKVSAANFISENPDFCRSALAGYTPQDFIALVRRHGIAFHEKHRGQLFCDGASEAVIAMLVAECDAGGVDWRRPCTVTRITHEAGAASPLFALETSAGALISDRVVVATGGLSIPKIGATDFAYRLARQFGLRVIEPRPALVPLTFDLQRWQSFAALAGVALEVDVRCDAGGGHFREDLLFTHRGLSGPAILQISSFWKPGAAIAIDLAPSVALAEQLVAQKTESRQSVVNALAHSLPRRLVLHWFDSADLPVQSAALRDLRLADAPDRSIRSLADSLQNWTVIPAGTEGFRKAEVTRGGVDTHELSQKTMEARRLPGLHFIGEAVDVTGWLGGYNFQWAWSSGYAAGQAV